AQCLEDGQWAQAAQAFTMIEKHLTTTDRNGLLLAQVMNSAEGGADVILSIANTQLESDAIDLATRLYNEALKRQPGQSERMEIQTKLGWCLYLQNQHADAEKIWLQVIADGSAGDPWRGRSRWHLIALNAGPYSNTRKAIELCEVQATEFAGGFLGQQAMLTRAWLLKIDKKWADAKIAFEALIAAYPHKADSPPIITYIEECEKAILKR
ncbi:MAG: tetratricopeptide repeat protein, partial [Lentisphaerae bacterium]|nr:tetratricopeptide repeat protein [Lentisphaerota bacterium]